MADTAKQVAEQAKDVAKAKGGTEEVTMIQEVHKKAEDIKDSVDPNS